MRNDLNKLLCECYREVFRENSKYGSFRTKIERSVMDPEVGGKRSFRRFYKTKSFGENLAFFPRWLVTCVDRPWAKCYSELSAVADRRSAVGAHIFQHVFDYVCIHGRMNNGRVELRARYDRHYRELKDSTYVFYVHPVTGIVLKNKHYKSYDKLHRIRREEDAREARKTIRVIDATTKFVKEDGIWYRLDMGVVPKATKFFYTPLKHYATGAQVFLSVRYESFAEMPLDVQAQCGHPTFVVAGKELQRRDWPRDAEGSLVSPSLREDVSYVAKKYQLSTKELARYNLTNDPK